MAALGHHSTHCVTCFKLFFSLLSISYNLVVTRKALISFQTIIVFPFCTFNGIIRRTIVREFRKSIIVRIGNVD